MGKSFKLGWAAMFLAIVLTVITGNNQIILWTFILFAAYYFMSTINMDIAKVKQSK